MARPQKEGIDYFPIDCVLNDRAKFILAEFKVMGWGILTLLWAKIYGGKGYYTRWDDDVALLFASECGVGVNVVKEVIAACLRRGLFDRQMYDRYQILTSEGIQERYAEATERRTSQKIDGRYLLINAPKNWVYDNKNSIISDINAENVCDNSQSKVNNSKLNNTISTTTEQDATPSDLEIIAFFETMLTEDKAGKEAFEWKNKNAAWGWTCLPDWKSAARRWVERIGG